MSMLHALSAAGTLRRTQPLLSYNKSSGYRWSPIPKPPPPHHDRLYGVHAVLNALRVAAAASQRQRQQQAASASSSPQDEVGISTSTTAPGHEQRALTRLSQSADTHGHMPAGLHPHRAQLSCLYVRDFSAEEAGNEDAKRCGQKQNAAAHNTSPADVQRRKKVIPPRYIAVRCIAALAKSLDVPVRFVPRSELVQLCGERRNQNVVLEVSSYVPHAVRCLDDIGLSTEKQPREATSEHHNSSGNENRSRVDPPPRCELVLFLEHIIDPTNIGGILRTAFFFGVDHVVLSRDCAACTATVSRTSTGFLEHLHVHQATVSTAEFLRVSQDMYATEAGSASSSASPCRASDRGGRLEVIASAVVPGEPAQPPHRTRLFSSTASTTIPLAGEDSADASSKSESRGRAADFSSATCDEKSMPAAEIGALGRCDGVRRSADVGARRPDVRLLLLGNEDAGLPLELLQWCTHVAHVRSPRQQRLRQARQKRESTHGERDGNDRLGRSPDAKRNPVSDDDDAGEGNQDSSADPHATSQVHALSELERREHNLQRLARLREKEVSLNVNTATAALLTALVAVEGELPTRASLGMVDVQACAL